MTIFPFDLVAQWSQQPCVDPPNHQYTPEQKLNFYFGEDEPTNILYPLRHQEWDFDQNTYCMIFRKVRFQRGFAFDPDHEYPFIWINLRDPNGPTINALHPEVESVFRIRYKMDFHCLFIDLMQRDEENRCEFQDFLPLDEWIETKKHATYLPSYIYPQYRRILDEDHKWKNLTGNSFFLSVKL